jgi:hypothetical protein
MRTLLNFRSKKFYSSAAFSLMLFTFIFSISSCSSDDELSEDIVGAVYTGNLAYMSSIGGSIASTSGTAVITETSSGVYSVDFSDGVPSITDLTFEVTSGGNYASVDEGDAINIGVSESSGENWAFSGSK